MRAHRAKAGRSPARDARRAATRSGLAAAALALALGCGTRASEQPAPGSSSVQVAPAPAEDEAAAEPVPEEPPPPSFDDAELDAMDRAGLESACFAGSTAACDRLGH